MRAHLLVGLMAVVGSGCFVVACSSSSSAPDGGAAGKDAAAGSGGAGQDANAETGGAAGQDASAGSGGVAGSSGDAGGAGGAAGSRTGLFLSDIHFNPIADPTLVDTLAQTPAAQWDSIFGQSASTGCSQPPFDTNFPLLQSALAAMKQQVPNPDIIFISGDLLVHEFQTLFNHFATNPTQASYEAFVNATEQYLAFKLTQTFPNAQIAPTLGDWDTSGGTTSTYANSNFLTSYATAWNAAVNRNGTAPDFQTTFSAGGYYSAMLPISPNTRLLGLYTQPWAAECTNGCAPDAGTFGTDEITWLTGQLADARTHSQKVWLIGHISPGVDPDGTASNTAKGMACPAAVSPFWADSYFSQVYALFTQYSDVLTFGIFAHEHYDDVRIAHNSSGDPTFAIKLVPSITPMHNNPTFVQFTYDPSAGVISDATTWYLSNLDSKPTANTAIWSKEYSFDETYGQTAYNTAGLAGAVTKILTQPNAHANFANYYPALSPQGNVLDSGLVPFYSWGCAINTISPADFTTCYCSALDGGAGDSGTD